MLFHAEEGPFGPERGDIHVGIVASTIANVNRGKGQPAYKDTEFRPRFGRAMRESRSGSDQQLRAELDVVAKRSDG